MIIVRCTGFLAQCPVIAQSFLDRIGSGRFSAGIISDAGRAKAYLFSYLICGKSKLCSLFFHCHRGKAFLICVRKLQVFFVSGQRHRICGSPGIFRPGIFSQIGNGNSAVYVIVQNLTGSQIAGRRIGNRNFRTAVRSQYLAVACTGNTAGQIYLPAPGINIFYYQAARLRVIIHLHDVFVSADACIIHRFVPVVYLIHGSSLYRNLGTRILVFLYIFIAQGIRAYIRFIFAEAALDQAIHIDICRSDIHTVPGNTASLSLGNIRPL